MSRFGPALAELQIDQAKWNECTVMIWNNKPGLEALEHSGHTSLLVRRDPKVGPWYMTKMQYGVSPYDYEPPYINSNERYISFWPVGLADAGYRADFLPHHLQDFYRELGSHAQDMLANHNNHTVDDTRVDAAWQYYQHTGNWPQPRVGQQLVIGRTVVQPYDDIWGTKPNALITLTGMSPTRPFGLGIQLNEVVGFAAAFKGSPHCDYHFLSKKQNCAGVAVRALVAGGSDAFSKLWGDPSKGNLYITPNDAEKYAKAVKIGIERTNNMLEHLRMWAMPQLVPLDLDLPTADAWKQRSAVDWKMRGAMLRNIDSALANYHQLTWQANFPEKLGELVTVIKNTYDHCKASRTNARTEAFKSLVLKIVSVVGQQALAGGTPWTTVDYYGKEVGDSGKKVKK
jgi:hypothetical protein